MKKETKRRIKYYKEILPGLKERVAAAGLMLVIAMIATVTATYAWVTLSRAPAVSGVNTTVTSNGNLEIALSPSDGSQPEEFDVDESAPKSTDIVTSNLQWGNLINLSDPSYGIDNLVLRPAELNTASLIYSPLWGAVYGADGRIVTKDSDYTFAKWSTLGNEFLASSDYGVRAIASYTLGTTEGANVVYNEKLAQVTAAHSEVNEAYQNVARLIPSMSSILSTYVQGQVPASMGGGAQDPFTSAQMQSMLNMYNALYDTMKEHEEALVTLANFQRYVNSINNNVAYEEITWEELEAGKANYNAKSADAGSTDGVIALTGLTQFINDYNTIKTDKGYVESYYNGAANGTKTIYWDKGGEKNYQIQDMISRLIDYSNMSVMIEGVETTFAQITGDVTGYATKLLGMNGDHTNAYIKSGIVKNFEQMAIDETYRLQGQTNNAVVTVKVTATLGISLTITLYGDCYTKAAGTSYYMDDYTTTVGNPLAGKQVVAEDTYGMAVDFWLRTNAESTYLTLEGALVTEEDPVSGERTILSYDGVNRVWGSTNTAVMTSNSTTQGGGSCYIYYADTPEDMTRSLSLLESMKVAFVDAEGNMVAGARMDTENYHALNGRITVPLVIEENTGVDFTYENDQGQEVTARALMHMVNDAARRLTAIIYLDGTRLTNNDVLAAADIQGQLNIQFGSSDALDTIGDDKLLVAERVVTATVDKTSMDYVGSNDEERTVNVVVKVDGDEPDDVTAFFVRAINATQGRREGTMTFTKDSSGNWTSTYTFDSPGTYYLRYVRLDGVDYALETPPKVEVNGFAIKSVTWEEASDEATIYTQESNYTEKVTVEFSSTISGTMPNTVSARFLREDGVMVNADLKYDSSTGKWTGTGSFYNSGTYTLQYLLLNGEYFDIGSSKILHLSLGMKTQVYNDGNTLEDKYTTGGTYSKDVGVKIFDNADKEITGLTGARLRYSLGGSTTNTVDTNLTWSDSEGWYKGTLPITRPGRYTYLEVIVGDNYLTRTMEAPTFLIISPDPPIYDVSSISTYHEEVQFAPLTNDAYIGPFTIENSGAVSISAEVHNSITGETYTVVQGNTEKVSGTLKQEGDQWYIYLPTYTDDVDSNGKPLDNAEYTQEGTWSVNSISVWNCYDEDSEFRSESNPIVWTDADTDFSKLSTTVSCSINVNMTPGITELGSTSAAFMANNYVNDIGMGVTIVDNEGRAIPTNKIKSVKLNVNYVPDPNSAEYGYKVKNDAAKTYNITMTYENGTWEVDTTSNYNWQYVGEYNVAGLIITMSNDATFTYAPGEHGVPSMYTVTSQGPTVDNLVVTKTNQSTVFGKTGDTVTGTFLQSYSGSSLGQISISMTPVDSDGKSHAILEGMAASLKLTYMDGSKAPNGGYTWSEGNPLTNITVPMTNNIGNLYVAGATSLLAGEYAVSAEITVGDEKKTVSGWDNIQVYSMKPDVTMTAVSPSGTITVNADGGINVSTNTFQGTNVIADKGKSAVVFASYAPFTTENNVGKYRSYTSTAHSADYADYSVPEITFKLSNAGSVCTDFKLTIPNNAEDVVFVGDNVYAEQRVKIGEIIPGTATVTEQFYNGYNYSSAEFAYNTETLNVIGTCNIKSISAVVNDITYTMTLNNSIFIRNENTVPPSIKFSELSYVAEGGENFVFESLGEVVSENGQAFSPKLPTASAYDYRTGKIYALENVSDWKLRGDLTPEWTAGTDYYAIYTGETRVASGYPNNKKDVAGFMAKQYQYTSKCEFEVDVYRTYYKEYQRTANTTTYEVNYGLVGWNIDGKVYEPGDEVKNITGNVIATPIIGRIGEPKFVLQSPQVERGMRYKDIQGTSEWWPGTEAIGIGDSYGFWDDSKAVTSGQNAANTEAAKISNRINKSGYTIINDTNALKYYPDESEIIGEGKWTTQ